MTFHSFKSGERCGVPIANEWCLVRGDHNHGKRMCDKACPCNTASNDPNKY